MADTKPPLLLFSGSSNPKLAEAVAKALDISLGRVLVDVFNDGERRIEIHDSVRGSHCFILQSPARTDVNDHLMELLLMIRTMKRASAREVTVVMPYHPYARADRKMRSRTPISASDTALIIEACGADRVLSVDLHCGQIQGFYTIPVDNLYASGVFARHFAAMAESFDAPVCVVSPDAGGVARAKIFINGLARLGVEASLALVVKQRASAGVIAETTLVGSENVAGSIALVVDDMLDTCGTLCRCTDELLAAGAVRVYAAASHGLFSKDALDKIANSSLVELIVTDTIPLPEGAPDKIVQLSVASLLADAISCVATGQSVSSLF
ncbi:ribose-phosphate pyrophosphokinase [Thecamonas trahens ATCC 50062]|uniref:ribose-phosphate diphosphokinase n=1 Tax=Thecamonas trahens ATCC 50062 TaxID=461836 RepID=A0A0L0DPY6_THETB|nr:ribose-phosphate pyrophosphokinase [Thecamonas trahens ATCC 50062]KNC54374.1 ribose-phosphate pyrophosphokinase [Thecamonas trahens ATCC 50062]|eukprot:XP_013753676.1 ribose-phosphate pyrophosphokinase [Thecamonas trahens ATCC 50062]